jgi:Tfp pilus assembly protein PilE
MGPTVVIIVVVVVVVVVALVAVAVRKGAERKRDRARTEAAEMRDHAAEQERVVRTHEAEAAEREAAARQARAESDRKAAEADKLQMQADQRGGVAAAKRDEQRDRLRAADDLDPDVAEGERTDVGVDENGHRHGGLGGEVHQDREMATERRDGPGHDSSSDLGGRGEAQGRAGRDPLT